MLAHIEAGNLTLKESLEMLVIDEADLIFSFGHEDDVKGILAALPNIYQSVLTSATLSDDVARYTSMSHYRAIHQDGKNLLSDYIVPTILAVGGPLL